MKIYSLFSPGHMLWLEQGILGRHLQTGVCRASCDLKLKIESELKLAVLKDTHPLGGLTASCIFFKVDDYHLCF